MNHLNSAFGILNILDNSETSDVSDNPDTIHTSSSDSDKSVDLTETNNSTSPTELSESEESDTSNQEDKDSVSKNSVKRKPSRQFNGVKDRVYCVNCGKSGHLYKKCNEPITSYGIILISLDINIHIREKFIECVKNVETDNFYSGKNGITVDDFTDIELFSHLKDKINFLMIQRKSTLGFIEFIRGRYEVDNIDGISYLFRQMTSDEINKIKTDTFDALWNELWGKNKNKQFFKNEYSISSKKFNKLKYSIGDWLNLDYYVEKIKPTWDYAEWGFPKGRRNYSETDFECSIREFIEETGLSKNEFLVFDNVPPIVELFLGTNGTPYRHIYYVGIIHENRTLRIDTNNTLQCQEIGDIKFMNYKDCINIIRPYHMEKKKIITDIYMSTINSLITTVKTNKTSNTINASAGILVRQEN